MKSYCTDGFYGPIFSGGGISSDLYYFGGLTKGNIRYLEDFEYDEDKYSIQQSAYIWGFVQIDLHPLESVELGEMSDEFTNAGLCFQQFRETRVKKSIGSEIASYEATETGLTMKFTDGDLCNPITMEYFSSEIELICDANEPEGWPIHKRENNMSCHQKFEWRTSRVCKHCTKEDVDLVEGQCRDGIRRVEAESKAACVIIPGEFYEGSEIYDPNLLLANYTFGGEVEGEKKVGEDEEGELEEFVLDEEIGEFITKHTYYISCSSTEDLFADPTFLGIFIVILCIALTLIAVAVFLCIKYKSVKTAYDKLRNDDIMDAPKNTKNKFEVKETERQLSPQKQYKGRSPDV